MIPFAEFEAIADASEATATDSGEAAVAADVTPEGSAALEGSAELVDASAATEAATPFQIDWTDPAVQQQAAPYMQQQLAETLQQLGIIGQEEQAPEPEYDPFDLQSVQGYVDHLFQQRAQAEAQSQREVAAVGNYVEQAVNAAPALKGIDGAADAVTFAASGFDALSQMQTGRSNPQWAVQQAARYLDNIVSSARTSAVTEYKQSIGGGNGAGDDPGVGGSALSMEPKAKTYDDVIKNWESRVPA